jgi:DNA repair protein RadC
VPAPRQRIAFDGASVLSDAELLAILLGSSSHTQDGLVGAAELLRASGGLWALRRMTVAELCGLRGVGPARAARLAAAFELGARAVDRAEDDAAPLSNSGSVFARYGRSLMSCHTERFLVVAVDAKNRPKAVREVARGGRSTCPVDPSEVFRMLVAESASGAIFVHNHPSGDPEPSPQDLRLTERLVGAGELLEIRILDHLIVGGGRYTSLRDTGLWPSIAVNSGSSARATG